MVGNRLIAALDVPARADADALVARLGGVPSWLKIGLELFGACGPAIVADYAKQRSVMLDLKLHDIPETVVRAVGRLASLGAQLLTVHAAGGRAMLEGAVTAAAAGGAKILAVTVLTSLDDADLRAVGATGTVAEVVEKRARLAIEAGCHGVVASPREVALIRGFAPAGFLIVTPGVRPSGAAGRDDQKRVMSAREARAAGADLVVVGRPLRDAADPAAAARALVVELS
jgi:orotidine-5'-phosphate decarboxylase|nr:orotidine-5'-phosphate decarboxylase [Kofleriaceae bacterium]